MGRVSGLTAECQQDLFLRTRPPKPPRREPGRMARSTGARVLGLRPPVGHRQHELVDEGFDVGREKERDVVTPPFPDVEEQQVDQSLRPHALSVVTHPQSCDEIAQNGHGPVAQGRRKSRGRSTFDTVAMAWVKI